MIVIRFPFVAMWRGPGGQKERPRDLLLDIFNVYHCTQWLPSLDSHAGESRQTLGPYRDRKAVSSRKSLIGHYSSADLFP
jgi:hypothetical protein